MARNFSFSSRNCRLVATSSFIPSISGLIKICSPPAIFSVSNINLNLEWYASFVSFPNCLRSMKLMITSCRDTLKFTFVSRPDTIVFTFCSNQAWSKKMTFAHIPSLCEPLFAHFLYSSQKLYRISFSDLFLFASNPSHTPLFPLCVSRHLLSIFYLHCRILSAYYPFENLRLLLHLGFCDLNDGITILELINHINR